MTTARSLNKKGRRIRPAPVRKPRSDEKASPRREKTDSGRRAVKPESTRSAQEFISDVGGHRTRWPIVIAVSLLIVCVLGLSTSQILF